MKQTKTFGYVGTFSITLTAAKTLYASHPHAANSAEFYPLMTFPG